ncbi:hypothetical protein DEIPH_ctg032orf0121 [Deinococcus phoenicis]|uniref:Uncharacterized protein n=1 Tax=Deinococcus phoenicis TaxID=1476583 RepID=A0A016QQ02_9DEIO|nr:hypothetical protein [Deinococcus phoenicis]EYB67864.1 hypothetical protein DEIPH_ctg032orf0121 [Deinococcus phoenicis]
MIHTPVKLALAVAAALTLTTARAIDRVPGTQTYYSFSKDPITDVNTSFVALYEVNDSTGETFFAVRCASFDQAELWAGLNTKNTLLSERDADLGVRPAVTVRLGNDPPIVLPDSELTTVVNSRGDVNLKAVAIHSAAVRRIVSGLNAGKRLVVRINRPSGGQALTYTFSANGFPAAWGQVRACGGGPAATSRPPSPLAITPAAGDAAPRFTRWYFTTCRDASSGTVRTGLLAGRAHLCDLVIETLPDGARPVSAEFRYELEYREGGRTGKLALDSVDAWPPAGGPVTKFRQSGNSLIFTLPLNVRARADRIYTSINVIATVNFDNGSSKRIYEPLPVKPAY